MVEDLPAFRTCTVFGESGVVSLQVGGHDKSKVSTDLKGCVAGRVAAQTRRVALEQRVMMTGGD